MELLCLVGMTMSMVLLVSQRCRDCVSYFALWFLYFSLFQVGQIFMWYQWDGLLLETGILAVLVAPWNITVTSSKCFKCKRIRNIARQHDAVTLWLVKWLLFRLMFASGVVKLSFMDPTWWSLTAMYWHYESQCIPTPVAWYFQKLPHWFHRLSTILTYVIEIGLPFLFFVPVRSLRLFAYCGQVFLQLLILLTGNYNFFNLLTIVLCISLLDDRMITSRNTPCCQLPCGTACRKNKVKENDDKSLEHIDDEAVDASSSNSQNSEGEKAGKHVVQQEETSQDGSAMFGVITRRILDLLVDYTRTSHHGNTLKSFRDFVYGKQGKVLHTFFVVLSVVAVLFCMGFLLSKWFYFELHHGKIMSWIAFSPDDYRTFVTKATLAGIWIGFISLIVEIIAAYIRIFLQTKRRRQQVLGLMQCTVFSFLCLWLFVISLDSLTDVSRKAKASLPTVFRKWYQNTKHLELAHSYGLFRSMTGVGGRPEIIVLGSNTTTGPWQEYNFRYKPSNIYEPPPFVAPHQPRLDWQMWFAALESFDSNPWFLSLLHKLLLGEKDVLELMGENKNFTVNSPPTYIRTQLYIYHYTENATNLADILFNSGSKSKAWWTREYVKDYTPFIISNDSLSSLEQILEQSGVYRRNFTKESFHGFVHSLVVSLRSGYRRTSPQNFINVLFFVVVILLVFKVWWRKIGDQFCTPKLIKVRDKCEPPLKQASNTISRCRQHIAHTCSAVTRGKNPIGRFVRSQCFEVIGRKLVSFYADLCLFVSYYRERGYNKGASALSQWKSKLQTIGPSGKKKK